MTPQLCVQLNNYYIKNLFIFIILFLIFNERKLQMQIFVIYKKKSTSC